MIRDLNKAFIDEWVQFAVNKKVEILELDIENSLKDRNLRGNYEFPLTLSVCKWPYSEARVVGVPTDLRLTNLPQLKEAKIYQGLLDNVLFRQISSCVSSVQTLSFTFYVPKLTSSNKEASGCELTLESSNEYPASFYIELS
ncbi:hypothetical protein L1987_75915 [Smallanthus sonchifolius]|uniref:Uncharacterized protein n=1 Tax=Smallanthus sonchifolius TaxID=185202 RepID=A0ACB9A7F4_9ASTR|nr:hypothetical protein L1987_75915 [Smallanthus sonchifolius]